MVATAGEEQAGTVIRTGLIAWVGLSFPFSILMGKMCRGTSRPLTGWTADVPAGTKLAPTGSS